MYCRTKTQLLEAVLHLLELQHQIGRQAPELRLLLSLLSMYCRTKTQLLAPVLPLLEPQHQIGKPVLEPPTLT
jgi:hypothetical protein